MRHILDLAGVAVFAISGVLAAGRKSLDWLGVAIIAVVTAIGGGTLRDVLLDRNPIFWIADASYLKVILGATALTLVYIRYRIPGRRGLLVADALGLAFFTIGGVQIAQQAGLSGLLAVLMGMITGVAGGVIRDVLCAEIPLILRKGQLYASSAIAGAALYLILEALGVTRDAAAVAGMAAIVLVRAAAIIWRLELPVLTLEETHSGSIRRPDWPKEE
ncbi:MAG TPA: trimeric intracellular cation channel family protein [Gemmatimonadales bacterium]|nr:trimeric intracellular cation channel family protein [Gemmatimonadales bacterium]